MTEKRKSFLIYIDTLPLFDELNDEDELSLCRAINHSHRDLPIELTAVARPLFRIFQAQFERDNERYLAKCNKNRASVLKRYEQQRSNAHEHTAKQTHTDSTDRDRESDIIPLSFKFSPLLFGNDTRRTAPSGGGFELSGRCGGCLSSVS